MLLPLEYRDGTAPARAYTNTAVHEGTLNLFILYYVNQALKQSLILYLCIVHLLWLCGILQVQFLLMGANMQMMCVFSNSLIGHIQALTEGL